MSIVTATIRTEALRHNLSIARQAAPNTRLMAVVKANAYGHGAVESAKALAQADAFAVARIEEALQLRQAGIDKPVALLSELLDREKVETCARQGFQPVVHDVSGVEAVVAAAEVGAIVVWLKVDTGMHRLGVSPEDCEHLYGQLRTCAHVDDVRLMTHFSSSEEEETSTTEQQIERFESATANLPGITRCLANSAAILSHDRSHAEWARPGLLLYGADPLAKANDLSSQLRPAMQLQSQVIAVREIAAGEAIGYNAKWHSERSSRIGTVAFGYADGYPRQARNGTPILVDGVTVPLVGRVSMDMITVDLTDHPNAGVGSAALLWGEGLPIERVAEHAGTIPYQLFTSVGGRTRLVHI